MNEKLSPSMGIKKYIDDFKKSDAPQFQGKSAEKRKEMAIAAYLDAKRGTKKEACWTGYKQVGLKKKGDRMVPDCVPESYNPRAARAQSHAANKMYGRTSDPIDKKPDSTPKKPISKADLFRALDKKYGSPKKKTGIYAKEAVDPADTGGAEETNMAVKQIAAMRHFLDGIESRVKKEGDMEEWYQNKLTKANDYLKTLYSYGKGDVAEEVEQIDELTAREKEMIAKRKASRTKKKMAPSQKAQKDAKRDAVGAFNSTKSRAIKKATGGAGSGKSMRGTEHIIMQLRKAQDVDGNMDIEVSPKGKKVRLSKKEIDALLKKHDSMQKPRDKRLFRVMLTRKLRQK
jgi:hypothetical protein